MQLNKRIDFVLLELKKKGKMNTGKACMLETRRKTKRSWNLVEHPRKKKPKPLSILQSIRTEANVGFKMNELLALPEFSIKEGLSRNIKT